ncbi:alpha/beta fold hydrolase [Burkholderia cenocepacia]|uniref:alpha/beta fold hydrolase n=1 Tax=Burkholderia cenocepacia TaxID=95486 RepID=UPI002857A04F|nr:alpha/beta hydrolase [Burkholderia cenocepacia]MDR8071900.1 alpha/beta hydrolase [Burkholderia cenocepacia]
METAAENFFQCDFEFPFKLPGLPERLSDLTDLKIGSFQTTDGVSLTYWKAGQGNPLIFLPGWSADGAEYINLLHVLREQFEVYVLDYRNHGLSQKVRYGNRVSRFSMDVHEFVQHIGAEKANFCGWSMGCAVLWSYIDLFGTSTINRLALIDEAPSIYCHSNWTEDERVKAGAFTTSAERMIDMFCGRSATNLLQVNTDIFDFYTIDNAPAFGNSHLFAEKFAPKDMAALELVLFDHILNDWRDVITHKIDVPTLVFSGEHSNWVGSQKWIAETVPGGKVFIYSKENHGDHFLHLKNPIGFSEELSSFILD